MSLTMIPHIHHWTPSTNVDYLCRLQMFTSNVDHSYTCWTDRRPTYPWHFPTPYITFVIFSYITSVIWTNRQCYVFVWPIVYPPIPGIFLLLLLLHEPVSNFHFQSLIYHIQVSWPLNPYIFWKLMMSAIQIRAKYKHKDNVSYVDKDAKGIIEWNNSVLYFQNLDHSSKGNCLNWQNEKPAEGNPLKWQTKNLPRETALTDKMKNLPRETAITDKI